MNKVIGLLLIESLRANTITCPKLVCNPYDSPSPHLDKNECYNHDNNQPTVNIMAETCGYQAAAYGELSDENLCDFDLASDKFAWVDENTQHLKSETDYGDIS